MKTGIFTLGILAAGFGACPAYGRHPLARDTPKASSFGDRKLSPEEICASYLRLYELARSEKDKIKAREGLNANGCKLPER